MPGVLQIEAMAQTAGAIVSCAKEDYAEHKAGVLFMSIDGVKFRKPACMSRKSKPAAMFMFSEARRRSTVKLFPRPNLRP